LGSPLETVVAFVVKLIDDVAKDPGGEDADTCHPRSRQYRVTHVYCQKIYIATEKYNMAERAEILEFIHRFCTNDAERDWARTVSTEQLRSLVILLNDEVIKLVNAANGMRGHCFFLDHLYDFVVTNKPLVNPLTNQVISERQRQQIISAMGGVRSSELSARPNTLPQSHDSVAIAFRNLRTLADAAALSRSESASWSRLSAAPSPMSVSSDDGSPLASEISPSTSASHTSEFLEEIGKSEESSSASPPSTSMEEVGESEESLSTSEDDAPPPSTSMEEVGESEESMSTSEDDAPPPSTSMEEVGKSEEPEDASPPSTSMEEVGESEESSSVSEDVVSPPSISTEEVSEDVVSPLSSSTEEVGESEESSSVSEDVVSPLSSSTDEVGESEESSSVSEDDVVSPLSSSTEDEVGEAAAPPPTSQDAHPPPLASISFDQASEDEEMSVSEDDTLPPPPAVGESVLTWDSPSTSSDETGPYVQSPSAW